MAKKHPLEKMKVEPLGARVFLQLQDMGIPLISSGPDDGDTSFRFVLGMIAVSCGVSLSEAAALFDDYIAKGGDTDGLFEKINRCFDSDFVRMLEAKNKE